MSICGPKFVRFLLNWVNFDPCVAGLRCSMNRISLKSSSENATDTIFFYSCCLAVMLTFWLPYFLSLQSQNLYADLVSQNKVRSPYLHNVQGQWLIVLKPEGQRDSQSSSIFRRWGQEWAASMFSLQSDSWLVAEGFLSPPLFSMQSKLFVYLFCQGYVYLYMRCTRGLVYELKCFSRDFLF